MVTRRAVLIGTGAVAGSASLAGCGMLSDVGIEEFAIVEEDGDYPGSNQEFEVDRNSQMHAYVELTDYSGGVPIEMVVLAEDENEKSWELLTTEFQTPEGGLTDALTGSPDLEMWEPIRPRPGFPTGEYSVVMGIDHDEQGEVVTDAETTFTITNNTVEEELQIIDTKITDEPISLEERIQRDEIPVFQAGDEVSVQFSYTFFGINDDDEKDVDEEITVEDKDGDGILLDPDIDRTEFSAGDRLGYENNPSGRLVDIVAQIDTGDLDNETEEYTVQIDLHDEVADAEDSAEITFELE